jgi:hypothetical protein
VQDFKICGALRIQSHIKAKKDQRLEQGADIWTMATDPPASRTGRPEERSYHMSLST